MLINVTRISIRDISVRIEILAKDNRDTDIRRYAAEALGQMGPATKDAVPALIDALNDEDKLVRDSVTEALEKIKPLSHEY